MFNSHLWVCLCLAKLLEVLYFLPHSPQACSSLEPVFLNVETPFEISTFSWKLFGNFFFWTVCCCCTWWCCCCFAGDIWGWNLGIWISFLSLEAVQMTMWVAFSGKVICIVRVFTGKTGLARFEELVPRLLGTFGRHFGLQKFTFIINWISNPPRMQECNKHAIQRVKEREKTEGERWKEIRTDRT